MSTRSCVTYLRAISCSVVVPSRFSSHLLPLDATLNTLKLRLSTFAQAVLGAELEIPTIDGKVKYTLPEGTQSGTTFRLKGKGIPSLNGRGRGDQYVTVYIETPRNLNKEQKEALKKFADTMGDNNYEEQKKFFKKFKK